MYGWQGEQTDKGTSDSETPKALLLAQGDPLDHFPAKKGRERELKIFLLGL